MVSVFTNLTAHAVLSATQMCMPPNEMPKADSVTNALRDMALERSRSDRDPEHSRYDAGYCDATDDWHRRLSTLPPEPSAAAIEALKFVIERVHHIMGYRSDVMIHEYGGEGGEPGKHRDDCRWCKAEAVLRATERKEQP